MRELGITSALQAGEQKQARFPFILVPTILAAGNPGCPASLRDIWLPLFSEAQEFRLTFLPSMRGGTKPSGGTTARPKDRQERGRSAGFTWQASQKRQVPSCSPPRLFPSAAGDATGGPPPSVTFRAEVSAQPQFGAYLARCLQSLCRSSSRSTCLQGAPLSAPHKRGLPVGRHTHAAALLQGRPATVPAAPVPASQPRAAEEVATGLPTPAGVPAPPRREPPTWLLLSAGRFLSRILRLLLSSRLVLWSLRVTSSGASAGVAPTPAPDPPTAPSSSAPDPAAAAILPAQRRSHSLASRTPPGGSGGVGWGGGKTGASSAGATPRAGPRGGAAGLRHKGGEGDRRARSLGPSPLKCRAPPAPNGHCFSRQEPLSQQCLRTGEAANFRGGQARPPPRLACCCCC